jgi:hypothetical protein
VRGGAAVEEDFVEGVQVRGCEGVAGWGGYADAEAVAEEDAGGAMRAVRGA